MDPATANPTTLILHDGELTDIRPILDALGAPSVERRGQPLQTDVGTSWDMVVATPLRLLELTSERGVPVGRVRIAVADGDSRTLRATLKRADASFLVRRPVHPVALRELLVQSLYSGPEKRRKERWSAGVPIRYRAGLRMKSGVLADISLSGCQLLSSNTAEVGQNLTVSLPSANGGARTLSVRGRVVRTSTADQVGDCQHTIHVEFSEQPKVIENLEAIVQSFATGPAQLPRDFVEERKAQADVALQAIGAEIAERDGAESSAEEMGNAEEEVDDTAEGRERRVQKRLLYSSRIIALGNETQVLSGRDISSGGLRTDMHPNVSIGDELQVAVPLPGARKPLVVKAVVVRNEEEPGLALSFGELAPEVREVLEQSLEFLPSVESDFEEEDDPTQVIVSEILEH